MTAVHARMAVVLASLAALASAALLAGACGREDAAGGTTAGGSTVRATLVDPDGDGTLERGPGERLADRTELAAAARPGRTLATFAQLTDAHVRDEESPARVPFLDRLGRPFDATFRPQESLTTQVLAATVRALDAEGPQAVAVTGDLIDNAQANELEQAEQVLGGGRVEPDSGARGYDGVQAASNPDPLYYRPDVDAPRHPGLLDRAARPFTSSGLRAPWFPAVGNHDVLLGGEVVPTPRLDAVATGSVAVTGLDPRELPNVGTDAATAVDRLLTQSGGARTAPVAPDSGRRPLGSAELVRRLARGRAVPASGRLDYGFDIGPRLRAVVLDTVRRSRGGARGLVLDTQAAWLERELARAGDRAVVVFSHNALDASDNGTAALAVLDRSPAVVAVVAGNAHRSRIRPQRTAAGGYWRLQTSSLADFPQQARMFRLRETAGGGLVLETWMVDHDGRGLAGVSRELAFLDAQGGRPQRLAGGRRDRNARLFLPGA